MRRRWITIVAVALALLGTAWWVGEWLAERPVPLLIVNRSDATVQLVLHGPGLAQDVLITALAAGARQPVMLQLEPVGAVRLRVRHPRADIDSALLSDGIRLRDRPHRLEIGPGDRFVLVPELP